MKYIFRSLIILLLFLNNCTAYHNKSKSVQRIDQIVKSIQNDANLGIIIKAKDKIIYEHNAKHLFTPASTIKLYTAYASLKYLGPEYKYKTNLYIEKLPKNKNNIYIKFSGDPSFTSLDLENMLDQLIGLNIKEINNIIIDDSSFDNILYTAGNSVGDEAYCFAAPTSAIIIDKNCFEVQITEEENNIHLNTADQTKSVRIINSLITSEEYIDWTSTVSNSVYNLKGSFKKSQLPKTIKLAYQNPRLLAKNLISNYLDRQKISIKGKIDFDISPIRLTPVFNHESTELKNIVKELLKESDNLTAESLVRTIAYNYYKAPGSNENGVKAITKLLNNTNIDTKKFRLADGVGSYYSLISPDSIVELLTVIRNDNEIYPHIFESLPIMGVDGTLKYYKNPILKEKIFAKTGTLKSAANLAGYAITNKNNKIDFAIMFNNFIIPKKKLLKIYEELFEIIIQDL